LRPETKATVERLHPLGVRTVLVTGDNRATAERIAAQLGIAEVLPKEKAGSSRPCGPRGDGSPSSATASTAQRVGQSPA
jgi:magnesium-transporting ATPase (P-type)